MKKIIIIFCLLLLAYQVNAEPLIQRVMIEPLTTVSSSSVTVTQTANSFLTVMFKGTKEIAYVNTSTSDTVYFGDSTVSPNTGYPLYPREELIVKMSITPNAVYFIGSSGQSTNLRIFQIK